MLAVVLQREEVFGAMSDYFLLPAFAILFIWLVVKIVKTVRDIRREKKEKEERGEDHRLRRWG